MRISDWSSDVCSSDLTVAKVEGIVGGQLGDNHAHSPEIAGGLRSSPTRSIRDALDGQRVSTVRFRIRSLDRIMPDPRSCQREPVRMLNEIQNTGKEQDPKQFHSIGTRRPNKQASTTKKN